AQFEPAFTNLLRPGKFRFQIHGANVCAVQYVFDYWYLILQLIDQRPSLIFRRDTRSVRINCLDPALSLQLVPNIFPTIPSILPVTLELGDKSLFFDNASSRYFRPRARFILQPRPLVSS